MSVAKHLITDISSFQVMIQGDTTMKASSLAFNKLRFGFTRLGGHTAMWTETLIPAETESEQAYTQAYKVSNQATRALLALECCECPSCEFCSLLDQVFAPCLIKQEHISNTCYTNGSSSKDRRKPQHGS